MNDREFIDWHLERATDELYAIRESFPHMKSGVHLSHAKGVLEYLFERREWEEDVDPFIVGLIGHVMSQLSRAEFVLRDYEAPRSCASLRCSTQNLLRNDDGDEQEAVFRTAMCVGRSIERLEIARERLE